MAVFIYDCDAYDRLCAVEGPRYTSDGPGRGSGYDYWTYREAWDRARAERLHWPDNVAPGYVGLPEGDGAIYGVEGYNRYVVRRDGEIVLVDAATPGSAGRAIAAGFRVVE